MSKPAAWWAESYAKILARVRGAEWPSRQFDAETLAGEILGNEFFVHVNTPDATGLYPSRWLEGLVDEAEDALRTEIVSGGGDWPQLWAFLCGCGLPGPAVAIKLEFAARLLEEAIDGGEPVDLLLEYFRLHERADVLAGDLVDHLPKETEGEEDEPEAATRLIDANYVAGPGQDWDPFLRRE